MTNSVDVPSLQIIYFTYIAIFAKYLREPLTSNITLKRLLITLPSLFLSLSQNTHSVSTLAHGVDFMLMVVGTDKTHS